jgi:hypothetical protein
LSSKEEHTTETDESAIAALAITGRKVNPLIEKRERERERERKGKVKGVEKEKEKEKKRREKKGKKRKRKRRQKKTINCHEGKTNHI